MGTNALECLLPGTFGHGLWIGMHPEQCRLPRGGIVGLPRFAGFRDPVPVYILPGRFGGGEGLRVGMDGGRRY